VVVQVGFRDFRARVAMSSTRVPANPLNANSASAANRILRLVSADMSAGSVLKGSNQGVLDS
jgi:hypothetical protein